MCVAQGEVGLHRNYAPLWQSFQSNPSRRIRPLRLLFEANMDVAQPIPGLCFEGLDRFSSESKERRILLHSAPNLLKAAEQKRRLRHLQKRLFDLTLGGVLLQLLWRPFLC